MKNQIQDEVLQQIQQLNESRFLLQQLNLQDQPTEQEILEKAQQLYIDDLNLARESLTKQLSPEWKPYCNRYGDIYYINLQDRLAYFDHPIDMHYKKLYSQINNLAMPYFRSFKIEQIAASLDLIEDQIKNFKMGSHKTTLRIVYEEPSQQQALSSYPKSPANLPSMNNNNRSKYQEQIYSITKNGNRESPQEYGKEEQLNSQQLQNLHKYQRQLQEQYLQQFKQYEKKIKQSEYISINQHESTKSRILQTNLQTYLNEYQKVLSNKNKIDMRKLSSKIQEQFKQKHICYMENILQFNVSFERFRQKQRGIANTYQHKKQMQKLNALSVIKSRQNMKMIASLQNLKSKILKQFDENLTSIINSQNLIIRENQIKKQLNQLYNHSSLNLNRKKIFNSHFYQDKQNNNQIKNKPNQQANNEQFDKRKYKQELQYKALKKQINELALWSQQVYLLKNQLKIPTFQNNSLSLNLRLRKKII